MSPAETTCMTPRRCWYLFCDLVLCSCSFSQFCCDSYSSVRSCSKVTPSWTTRLLNLKINWQRSKQVIKMCSYCACVHTFVSVPKFAVHQLVTQLTEQTIEVSRLTKPNSLRSCVCSVSRSMRSCTRVTQNSKAGTSTCRA